MKSLNDLLVDPKTIEKIIKLESDPELRNLLITQSYHDLATALSWVLGTTNTNWCHFASWASKTAGTFIRNEEVPLPLRVAIEKSERFKVAIVELKKKMKERESEVAFSSIGGLFIDIVANVNEQITGGNLKVYSELAPIFSSMIEMAHSTEGSVEERIESIVGRLEKGKTEDGGQQLLKDAVSNYFRAAIEKDQKAKAELMLLANGQIGLHEQIRLQPYIKDSLDAAISVSLNEMHEDLSSSKPKSLKKIILSGLSHLVHPLEKDLLLSWEDMATKVLMTMEVPDQTLHLGKPLPAPKGKPLYPQALQHLQNKQLIDVLDHYKALNIGKDEVATKDWAVIKERMRYIFNLFRSRQQVKSIFSQPFGEKERLRILNELM
jgi:hypothetical protein